MNIFEWLVIATVALIVLGPERLSDVAIGLGKFVRKINLISDSIKTQFDQHLQEEQLRQNTKRAEEVDKSYAGPQSQDPEINNHTMKAAVRDTDSTY